MRESCEVRKDGYPSLVYNDLWLKNKKKYLDTCILEILPHFELKSNRLKLCKITESFVLNFSLTDSQILVQKLHEFVFRFLSVRKITNNVERKNDLACSRNKCTGINC